MAKFTHLRKPKAERTGKMLTVRVTREQYDRIEAAADSAGISMNAWCREMLAIAATAQLEKSVQ